eukprot:7022724-Pyramimonas_sp.AAC.1
MGLDVAGRYLGLVTVPKVAPDVRWWCHVDISLLTDLNAELSCIALAVLVAVSYTHLRAHETGAYL